jgi:hypothetical protein
MRRAVVEDVPRIWISMWLGQLGKTPHGHDGLAHMSVWEMDDLLYAAAWCRAWGKTMSDYIDGFGNKRYG